MARHRPRLAWVRYGSKPLSLAEAEQAAPKYRAAIIQPWDGEAAALMKQVNPHITVLAYQCMSSVRVYEPGPIFSSGVCAQQAEELGSFALNSNGERIEWSGYPGHFQQKVWDDSYQRTWVDTVVQRFTGSPFDGVFADNDVYDDYYNLNFPLLGGETIDTIHTALNKLVVAAGKGLAGVDKLLIPNIAEARRESGRWTRHSAFGGGFEECWMGWENSPETRLDYRAIRQQMRTLRSPGLNIVRTPGTGEPGDPNLLLALAAAWVFAPTSDVAVTATAHDGYNAMPWCEQAEWDLGKPLGPRVHNPAPGLYIRLLTDGVAAVNLSDKPRPVGRKMLGAWQGLIKYRSE